MRRPKQRALELWREGSRRLLAGDLREAVRLFDRSLAIHPTAEAYTFRGWACSFEGRLEEAIADCRRAIATDPTFGNAYNDIGSYLVTLGRPQEAVAWFEKAKGAARYEPRHFPYLNLGRLYAAWGRYDLAAAEFASALEHNPGDPVATAFLEEHPLQVN